ncbi:calcium-binding protein [Actinoplanes sp. HUAS TT8]|uniref:calcium-binding protein n=1 Tax=Actinoplanes sp. HUAS TT8 TaxID=3447453 RepID=UPI003F520F80
MDVRNRRLLAGIGLLATTAASVALFAAPAQAATSARAELIGTARSGVFFKAGAGQVNSLVITVSGRTVTFDDKVAIKAGKGCVAVRGDRTKVRCVTARKPTAVEVYLGDRSDSVTNRTSIPMYAEGASGNDTLIGGAGVDRLLGGTGNDRIYGNGGNDALAGDEGNDVLYGGNGNDWVDGYAGNDYVHGGNGNDTVIGGPGRDRVYGGAGKDKVTA